MSARAMTSWRVEPAWAVSCVLEDVTVLPLYITVTMTGNAGDGAEVPCINVSVDLQLTGLAGETKEATEEVVAPSPVSTTCKSSVPALVHWEVLSLFQCDFQFQLEVQRISQQEPTIKTVRS